MSGPGKILIVDDDPAALSSLGEALERDGHAVMPAGSGEEAIALGDRHRFDIVLTDLRMKGIDGLQVLRTLKARQPDAVFIVMTGFASMDTVVDAISAGAYDYISKPFRLDQMRLKIRQALEHAALLLDNRSLREKSQSHDLQNMIIGSSPAMIEVFKTVAKAAASDATVLIEGESGTGKELVARAIHRLGNRRDRPFLAVNCASVAENLLESELFGYVRGAFTGAMAPKPGIFGAADHGTVLLDEIGDTSPSLQAKLLRVLESGEFMPVGSTTVNRVDVRVIAATHRDLRQMAAAGGFREDLLYRLRVITTHLPPLRERLSDLPLLFDFFLRKYSEPRKKSLAVQPELISVLLGYSWPGNVRQLENAVQSAVALNTSGVFSVEDLPEEIRKERTPHPKRSEGPWPTLAEVEERYIQEVLEAVQGNMSQAAEILGIDRRTLYRKVDRSRPE